MPPALYDPTRPPCRAVLLGPDGAVLRRTTRHRILSATVYRLGTDGQPDQALPVTGGVMTVVDGPDDDTPVDLTGCVGAEFTVPMTSVSPDLVALLRGGLVTP